MAEAAENKILTVKEMMQSNPDFLKRIVTLYQNSLIKLYPNAANASHGDGELCRNWNKLESVKVEFSGAGEGGLASVGANKIILNENASVFTLIHELDHIRKGSYFTDEYQGPNLKDGDGYAVVDGAVEIYRIERGIWFTELTTDYIADRIYREIGKDDKNKDIFSEADIAKSGYAESRSIFKDLAQYTDDSDIDVNEKMLGLCKCVDMQYHKGTTHAADRFEKKTGIRNTFRNIEDYMDRFGTYEKVRNSVATGTLEKDGGGFYTFAETAAGIRKTDRDKAEVVRDVVKTRLNYEGICRDGGGLRGIDSGMKSPTTMQKGRFRKMCGAVKRGFLGLGVVLAGVAAKILITAGGCALMGGLVGAAAGVMMGVVMGGVTGIAWPMAAACASIFGMIGLVKGSWVGGKDLLGEAKTGLGSLKEKVKPKKQSVDTSGNLAKSMITGKPMTNTKTIPIV